MNTELRTLSEIEYQNTNGGMILEIIAIYCWCNRDDFCRGFAAAVIY